jgi:hypothetical protein
LRRASCWARSPSTGGTRRLRTARAAAGFEILRAPPDAPERARRHKEIKALGREGFFYRTYAEKQRELLALGYLGVTLEAIPPVVVERSSCGALVVALTVTARSPTTAAASGVRTPDSDHSDGQPAHLAGNDPGRRRWTRSRRSSPG